MKHSWGRFTALGGAFVEAQIARVLSEAVDIATTHLNRKDCRALVLIGGYGRGEGGIQVIKGQEQPHNNFDLLLIANRLSRSRQEKIKGELGGLFCDLGEKHNIGIDLGIATVTQLARSPCLVMWYDMRFGHKTLWGDSEFVPSLTQFRLDRLLPSDIRNLLVNRGTLFLVNDLLFEKEGLSLEHRKLAIKHAMKGIIGYGDALLFFLGDYHWSYREKQIRMSKRTDVPNSFRKLYDEAISFRFRPCYEKYLEKDLPAWILELKKLLSAIHLQCESHHLNDANLTWNAYFDAACRGALFDEPRSLYSLAKKGLNLIRGPRLVGATSLDVRLGARCAGYRGLLSILFPAIAYHTPNCHFRNVAKQALMASSTDDSELRRAYLKMWSVWGDVNFPAVLRKQGLSLDLEVCVS